MTSCHFHNVPRYRYTCITPSITAPPFPRPRCRRSIADRISRNRYLRGENYAASTGRRCFNRAARSRGACETEALRTIRLIYRVDDTPPLFYDFIDRVLSTRSIALSNRISRSLPHLAPHLLSTFFVLAVSTSSIRFIPYTCIIDNYSKNISKK